ncbi:hypothetical protein [Kaistella sp.]|uniref:hypothetical protein n=1 Tax=Kaistella sp. TaxID=2782235 RepID=UPI003C6A6568
MEKSNIINRTNLFYLEISSKILSQKEYQILYKMIIEKKSVDLLAAELNIPPSRVNLIYERLLLHVKAFVAKLNKIDITKEKRKILREKHLIGYKTRKNTNLHKLLLGRKILDGNFPFSLRLTNMLNSLELFTIEELTKIPLSDYLKFRGFKTKCMIELIEFIEFENLEFYFERFVAFKKQYHKK